MELQVNDVIEYRNKTFVLKSEINVSVLYDPRPHRGFELLSFPLKQEVVDILLDDDYDEVTILVRGW